MVIIVQIYYFMIYKNLLIAWPSLIILLLSLWYYEKITFSDGNDLLSHKVTYWFSLRFSQPSQSEINILNTRYVPCTVLGTGNRVANEMGVHQGV
jgi:hypothetical protein